MAKTKTVFGDNVVEAQPDSRSWLRSHGTMIAGRAYLDGADHTASEMEAKWGADRLRLLVSPELREKFDRQRYKLNQAIWHGELEDVKREAGRMVKAYEALDRAAEAVGASKLSPLVWEVPLASGRVAAIVGQNSDASAVTAEGRCVDVYTLDEIGRLLDGFPALAKAKATWPGASVTQVRRSVEDPLLAVHDTKGGLDDEIPF